MNSDTVNPMPAIVDTPTMSRHVSPSGSRANRSRTASAAAPVIPTVFPTIRPTATPSATAPASGASSASAVSRTPALARAKIGTTTKLVNGWSRCWRRSASDTVSLAMTVICRISSALGSSDMSAAHCSATSRAPAAAPAPAARTPRRPAWDAHPSS